MIPVLYENADVVVVDKPGGVASIPERQPQGESLVELLSAERGEKLYTVHRLDKDTSGAIVFARNAQAHRWLNRQFEHRLARKTYVALVHGVMIEDGGTVDEPLRQFGSGRIGVDREGGKASVTEFTVVERYKAFTLVEARPRTGRRHQIRVHLYHLGHPVAGDRLYGGKEKQEGFARLMLHARSLALRLPSGEDLVVEAPAPESFIAVLRTAEQE
jgi:tRNA pseudouridine32 synthase / 23S rRNA pseudouridine746 synthase